MSEETVADEAEVELLRAEVRRRGRLLKMSTEEIHSLHEQVEATEARADEAESILIRVVQQANTHAVDGDDGFIAAYHMPVGPVHAAIPFLQRRGIYVGESGGVYRANPIEHDGNGVVGLDRDALAEIIEWDIREDRDRSFASEQARRIADKILAALSTAGKGGK